MNTLTPRQREQMLGRSSTNVGALLVTIGFKGFLVIIMV